MDNQEQELNRPKVLFLENVKNLKSHDNGKTFQTIYSNLENLGIVAFDKQQVKLDFSQKITATFRYNGIRLF